MSDRVSYSFNLKVGLPNYGSAGVTIGLDTDVREGETSEKAFKRAKKFVEDAVERETDEIRTKYLEAED